MKSSEHIPVLIEEVLNSFSGCQLKVFYDGTLGAGGHANAILTQHPEIELYIGADQDESALSLAKETLKEWKDKVVFVHGNFSELGKHLKDLGVERVDGFLFDLGVSSMQLDQEKRGFSFLKEGPLDMRMDRTQMLTAKDIVNTWSEKDLGDLFRDLGEEPRWKRCASAVAKARRKKPLKTTLDLASVIEEELKTKLRGKLHPATLVFQALRMKVNRELESIQAGLRKALEWLHVEGRIGVISFHSFEDRLVKTLFREVAKPLKSMDLDQFRPVFEVLTKKPTIPTAKETRKNVRSRSAKLRVLVRTQ
ncbi:MAG: 16S rRNA (cytosine(1402)-N(4))-methyltransferase RsmH [Simkaniaceae bacterium]|nr:16S rRNA (cytosine(1402)-N(4))-methyltransferase RsmH [Simkaniaceae bacterium]